MNPRVLEHLRTAGEHCDEWQLNAKGEQAASEAATGYTASKSARRAVSGGEAHRTPELALRTETFLAVLLGGRTR